MTPREVALVQESFAAVVPREIVLVHAFYARLFEIDPRLKHLFRGDMGEQQRRLMTMLALMVSSLGKPETITPLIEDLGVRHVDYGVEDKDYDTAGDALLWALERVLGPALSTEARAAWAACYAMVAGTMMAAARRRAREYPPVVAVGSAASGTRPGLVDGPGRRKQVERLGAAPQRAERRPKRNPPAGGPGEHGSGLDMPAAAAPAAQGPQRLDADPPGVAPLRSQKTGR